MFDIGFTELLVCLVVALVVIGPEQLPGAVRAAGLWIGRLKRSLRDTRNEIERQIGADDIRRQLHNEEVMQNIEAARIRFEQSILDVGQYENTLNETPPQASDYGPPDELPDHAHGDQTTPDQRKPAAPTPVLPANSQTAATTATAVGTNTPASNPPNAPAAASSSTQPGTGH